MNLRELLFEAWSQRKGGNNEKLDFSQFSKATRRPTILPHPAPFQLFGVISAYS